MRTQKAQDSHQAPESSGVEKTEQTWRVPRENICDEVTHLKTTGVGKAKRKTRRGKRGGVKRKMQNLQRVHKKLEAAVGHWIKDIRHKMEAPQSDHAPSRDVTVDVLASDVDEMSITPSHVEPLLDYEHYFPEIDNVIDNRVDDQSYTGSAQAPRDIYSYHGNNSTTAPEFGQLGMVLGCGHHQGTECGHGNGQECGFGYGNGHKYGHGYDYGNGQEYGYGNGQGYGYGNHYRGSFYRYCD